MNATLQMDTTRLGNAFSTNMFIDGSTSEAAKSFTEDFFLPMSSFQVHRSTQRTHTPLYANFLEKLLHELKDTLKAKSYLSIDKEEQKKEKLSSLYNKLECYKELDDDWDGYNGNAPSEVAVSAAQEFAVNLSILTKHAIPSSMLSGEGEVSLWWDNEYGYVEIGFEDGDTYSFYASLRDGTEVAAEDVQRVTIHPALDMALAKLGQKSLFSSVL